VEDSKGNMTDIESNIQRVKHEITEALRYVVHDLKEETLNSKK
jgi:hypothetical protein